MKWRMTFLILLASCCICFAQNKKTITVVGRVADTDNTPLLNATVLDLNSQRGIATGKKGTFVLNLPNKPTTLQITYVGYHTLNREITSADLIEAENDTVLLSILLEPKIAELAEVEINASNTQLAYDYPEVIVLDYDFHPEGLLLLLSLGDQYKLRLVDAYSNTLDDLRIPNHPEQLVRDCLGNRHLLYKDSTYQLARDYSKLALANRSSRKKFDDFLKPCVATGPEKLFFHEYGPYKQSLTYFSVGTQTQEKQLVQRIVDREMLRANSHYDRQNRAESMRVASLTGDNNVDQQRESRDLEVRIWFYEIIFNTPIYNPLLQVRDSLFVFNHVSDTVFVYDRNGVPARNFPIDYHFQSGWKNELIIDRATQHIYAKCVRGGLAHLLQIDPMTGIVLGEFRIGSHLFPENIKVRNGIAHYLYTEKKGKSVQNLYQQKLY